MDKIPIYNPVSAAAGSLFAATNAYLMSEFQEPDKPFHAPPRAQVPVPSPGGPPPGYQEPVLNVHRFGRPPIDYQGNRPLSDNANQNPDASELDPLLNQEENKVDGDRPQP